MSRRREPGDWAADRSAARLSEEEVGERLRQHPQIARFADLTEEMDTLDFSFRFEQAEVRVDVKAKLSRSSNEIAEQWPDVPRDELFILDETAFRTLVWDEGLGYLIVKDEPRQSWHVFGPWELCLGPRRRFERLGDMGAGEFLKGKLLLDLRSASSSGPALDVDAFLDVVRRTRSALRQVRAIEVRGEDALPVIPRPAAQAGTAAPTSIRPEDDPPVADPGADEEWAGLSADLVQTVKRRWDWSQPTDVQRLAFPAVLAGANTLVLGPTAGGKTEAALLPLMDLWRRRGWTAARPSLLVVSPLRALIDDQLVRWRRGGALVGAKVASWHGGTTRDERRAFKDNPTDVLLITPESLELLMTSSSHDERTLFEGLQAVVVDEVHSFAGTARGAQLVSLLERLDRFVAADLQRVGLSATVGNPTDVLAWLRGGSLREHVVVDAGPPMRGEQLDLVTYEDAPDGHRVIASAIAGRRAIVFVRSRRRAEELGHGLALPVHHGSVATMPRSVALRGLADGGVSAVVATTTLEMGIDVADLDLVVHDGAPSSPASYLQRLGRSGHQTGHRRMTFACGDPDDLLLTLAVVARARRGDVGDLPPQRGARLVLGQQALAIALQQFITSRHEVAETLRWSTAFAGMQAEIDATIEHLLMGRFLQADADRIVLGPEGHRRFGGRGGVAELLATFKGVNSARAIDEAGRHVADVDWDIVERREGRDSKAVVLAGRAWTVVKVDRERGVAVIRPARTGQPASWRGPVLEVERPTWASVREVLAGTEVPMEMDARAHQWLEQQRLAWAPRLAEPVRAEGGATVVDSFAGIPANRSVLAALGLEGTPDGASCVIEGPLDRVKVLAAGALADLESTYDIEAVRLARQLDPAHPELIAASVMVAEARSHHVDEDGIRQTLQLLADAG